MASLDGRSGRPRGRPRDYNLDDLIRTATTELLGEGGEVAAALDDVAARAGVGKATIYRRWATKRELIEDVVASHLPIELPSGDHGSLVADARALLATLVDLLGTPQARAARQLLAGLYGRLLSAQTRELAADAGLTQLTRLPHGRCCLLTPNLLDPARRHLQQLATSVHVDEDLRARCRTALEHLHRQPPPAPGGPSER